MIATVVASFLHIYWCNLFVIQKDLDIIGIGLAKLITSLLEFFVTLVYAHLVHEI